MSACHRPRRGAKKQTHTHNESFQTNVQHNNVATTTIATAAAIALPFCSSVLLCCCWHCKSFCSSIQRRGLGYFLPSTPLYPQRKWKSPKKRNETESNNMMGVGSYCYRLNRDISFENRCIVWGIVAYAKNILGNLMKIIIITELKQ